MFMFAGFTAVMALEPALADEERGLLAYDISWPQCPDIFPAGEFEFAVIGLTDGKPFTTNDCFPSQYAWAKTAQANPDVYINLDFPQAGRREALTGPYGRCDELDHWCRGYNWGYALAKDSVQRARAMGVTPGRYWFDVEMANYWTNWPPFNAQVVRGALDFFLDFHLPIGIYGTNYQWGLITGGFEAPGKLPLWVAGATSREGALARCGNEALTFAGGETWMVQYPEGPFDGNVLCEAGRRNLRLQEEIPPRSGSQTAAAPVKDRTRDQFTEALALGGNQQLTSWSLSEARQLLRR